jgi:general secretion pathway protein F
MPRFTFEAVDTAGARSTGAERADSEAALTRQLEARGLYALEVTEAPPAPLALWRAGRRRRDVLELTRAIASLLAAGLPLTRALAAARGVTGPDVRDALDDVRARVDRGESLATALRSFPQHFSPVYTGIVHAGERSGDLDTAFTRLAVQLEQAEQLRGRVLAALLYPALLAVAGAIAVIALLVIVLPRFATLLLDAGAGGAWRYDDRASGLVIGRSEGLGIASLRAFAAGLFLAYCVQRRNDLAVRWRRPHLAEIVRHFRAYLAAWPVARDSSPPRRPCGQGAVRVTTGRAGPFAA